VLALAICIEIVGTVALRESHGFSRPLPVLLMLSAYALSLYMLSVVVRRYPIGLTYAIWAGVGTALIALLGVIRFHEEVSPSAGVGLALVVAGVVLIGVSGLGHGS
jgi:small multidrug resistance pump